MSPYAVTHVMYSFTVMLTQTIDKLYAPNHNTKSI